MRPLKPLILITNLSVAQMVALTMLVAAALLLQYGSMMANAGPTSDGALSGTGETRHATPLPLL